MALGSVQGFNNSNDRCINNQQKIGGLAQLVERVLSMHEVVSSILTFSKLLLLFLCLWPARLGNLLALFLSRAESEVGTQCF